MNREDIIRMALEALDYEAEKSFDADAWLDIRKALREMLSQPRQWQGLTDEEQQAAYDAWQQEGDGWGTFYALIEAKLKEKNA